MIVLKKKALSTLVSTLLILFVVVVAFTAFFSWYLFLSDQQLIEYQTQLTQESVEIMKFNSSSLFVRVYDSTNITYSELKISGTTCSVSGVLEGAAISEIDVSSCTGSLTTQVYDVTIIGNQGAFTTPLVFRDS
jgi:hypothetical protein